MRGGHSPFAHLTTRDGLAPLIALVAVMLLCWWYLAGLAAEMGAMAPGEMMAFKPWTPTYFALMLAMWSIMMIAMMLPSAAPMILLYRQVARKNHLIRGALGTALFAGGYLTVWAVFSLVATTLQWRLELWAVLSPAMRSQNVLFSGLVLIAAGIYQWSPWKQACLTHCRGPLFFITRHWQPGLAGAFEMGIVHGAYCVGCCGALMALLFVGGVMDLSVIAAIAVIVLLEKTIPGGEWLAKGLGVVAIGVGLGIIMSGQVL
ncbi:DUF2182 domain-containing protein [Marinobacter caseinilyticus]|uniref:DUF2182 domain-containing protein n=1 Tax=Marinobacter caseinilyticus TaxID=2692195 RepID=UPI0014091148|nr:DUF2182 domain-containing protein [Marinobacter caseinilyticus]